MTREEVIGALRLAVKRRDGMHLRAKTDKRWYVAVAVKKTLLREVIALLTNGEPSVSRYPERLVKPPCDVE